MDNKIKKPITKGVADVPVVMQMEYLECGAASLTMILAYYDKWIPLEKVRADCNVTRDGCNAKMMLQVARSYGLKASAYKYEPESLKQFGTFPCIVHWEFDHFIVLDGFKGNKAVINDPAKGRYTLSMEEFDKGFTGVCLMFEPTEEFVPSGKRKSVFSYAKDRLPGSGKIFLLVIITTLLTSVLSIIMPAFSRVLIDRLLSGHNPDWVIPFTWAMAGVSFLIILLNIITVINNYKVSGKFDAVGSTSYMWKVLSLPMNFFFQRTSGDIQNRMFSSATIAKTLVYTFSPLFLNMVMLVVFLVVMISYSPILSLVGVVSVLINIGISKIISDKRVNITRVQMRDNGLLAGTTVNGINMIETIKANGAENGFISKWAGYLSNVNNMTVKYAYINVFLGSIPTLLVTLTNTAVLMLGVLMTINGHFTVGMILAFQSFMQSFTSPATTLITAGQTIQEMRGEMERIDDVMKYPNDINVDNHVQVDEYSKLSGNIEIKDVTFGYSPFNPPIIENLSLSIKQGQKIAFVGSSGCGKSTVSKLISGIYRPWSGDILFDGKHIDEINRSVFTGSIAVVDQEITLFEDTIANNIKMWDSSIEDYEMILAARDAGLHDEIMLRDGGYQYMIHEDGSDFSGGQRQKIELARVLAQDPTIIILDEATSALDAKTEQEVVNAITMRGITCIVIAHRLSTIRDCDEILVMDKGAVAERGTHDELIKQGGLYTRLVTSD